MADVQGVGQNLQDHPVAYGLSWVVKKGTAMKLTGLVEPIDFIKYIAHRTGVEYLLMHLITKSR